jgi:hypothetical protein
MKSSIILVLVMIMQLIGFSQERKLLIIGIDGCRPDALMAAETPNIDELIANSTYSLDALTHPPTYSGPGWSNMLTGVWEDKHGVIDNSFVGSQYDDYPHLFNLLKSVDPGYYLASVCQWHPINDQIVDEADFIHNAADGQDVSNVAVSQLGVEELDAMFIHFDDVDIAGHTFTYSIESPQYLAAIEQVDVLVGPVVDAIESRPNFVNEEWLVILSTDHGGIGFGHGGGSYDERNIFTIFSGNNFPNEEVSTEYEVTLSDESNALNLNANDVYAFVDEDVYEFGSDQDFTIELKLKTNGWGGDPSIVSDKDWNSGYNPGFVFALQSDGATWKFNLGDGVDRIDLNGGLVSDGEWHHLAVSVDRDGEAILMHDGEVVATAAVILNESINSGLMMAFGQDGTLTYDYDFDGWIDELRVWTKALSPEIIQGWSCANISMDHPDWDDLIGYWKMEETGDFIVYDSGPFNNHATLVNGPYLSLEGTMECPLLISEAPEMVDIVYTGLIHMCVEINPDWELDGQVWGISEEDCNPDDILEVENPPFAIVPNPSAGRVQASSIYNGILEVHDLTGKLVFSLSVDAGITQEIDLNLPAGHYSISLVADGRFQGSQPLIIMSE